MPVELAFGFVDLEALLTQRITEVGLDRIGSAVTTSVEVYQEALNSIIASMVFRTTNFKEMYDRPATGTLQPLDEHGNPKPMDFTGSYEIGYPIEGGGTAWGGNRVVRELMTVAEANKYTLMVQQQDADWMRRHILAAVLNNASYVFRDKQHGNITVYPLANNDTVEFSLIGLTAAAADNHYLAQAAAISDGANPFPTIRAELVEHPGNGETVVAFIPEGLKTSVTGLLEFVEVSDVDIVLGSGSDTVGRRDELVAFGDELLGKTKSGVWIVLWKALPAGYMFVYCPDAGPFIAQREYPAASLQGLFPEFFAGEDGNHYVNRFIRYAGFGVQNRTAGLVYQVGNATYQVPAGYTIVPLPY